MVWDDDAQLFVLCEPMDCFIHKPSLMAVRVPQGFMTDLASIPKRLQSVVGKLGHHLLPAILHDYMYVQGAKSSLTKKQADQIFLDGMKAKGVSWYRRYVMYAAVRANINGGNW